MPARKPRVAMSAIKLAEQFGSEEKCRRYVEELRWPDGVRCPRCKSDKLSRLTKRWQFDCDSCRYQFSPTAGTIFHDSHLPLFKWFMALYLMIESRKGISANQMKRTLEVSYKTAWYLCHREALKSADAPLLDGTVECDETWVGGRRRGVGRGNYRQYRKLVLAAIQRGGDVRMSVEKRADRATLHKFISDNVAPNAEAIYTDENEAYKGVADEDTRHETVNHSADEWVRGDVHTNTIEGVFSLFKRSVVGAYHQLSAKHLDRYLDEFEFRFNNRKNPYLFRDALIRLLGATALPYRALVDQQASG
jgi:transposase-like protein